MLREISCFLGYECCTCGKVFEFPFDAHNHDAWCSRHFRDEDKLKAQKQIAQIKIETFKPDGSRAGIALSEPEPIEIVPDLVAMRRSVKNLIGRWS